MNPHLLSALEKLKIGDIKSSMDQIRSLYGEVALIKQEIETLFTELDSKVSLVSRKLDGPSTVSKLGTGIIASITSAGTVLNGTGTLFSKEVAIGNQIKIGSETVTVTGLDSLSPDIKMTVTPALVGSYANQIFAIIKPATKELLKGEFDFGELNGDTFNGVVRQGSSLETFGRMTQPSDVVNVSFVQKQTTPIMVRAQNAIQRDGDNIVGPSNLNRYEYTFDKTTFLFGDNSTLDFSGIIGSPTSLTTKQYVDNAFNIATTKFYKRILGSTTYTNGTHTESSNIDDYLTVTGNGIIIKKPCLALIIASVKGSMDKHYNASLTYEAVIKNRGVAIANSLFIQDTDNTNETLTVKIPVLASVPLIAGDSITISWTISSTNGFTIGGKFIDFDLSIVSL
jgi:hypothetical protein